MKVMQYITKYLIFLAVCAFLSGCDKDDNELYDPSGIYYNLVKAKDSSVKISEKDGIYSFDVPVQGGVYEFQLADNAYYIYYYQNNKNQRYNVKDFDFKMLRCYQSAPDPQTTPEWDASNPEMVNNFYTQGNAHQSDIECFFGRYTAVKDGCTITVDPNPYVYERTIQIVLSDLPDPTAIIEIHQRAK